MVLSLNQLFSFLSQGGVTMANGSVIPGLTSRTVTDDVNIYVLPWIQEPAPADGGEL